MSIFRRETNRIRWRLPAFLNNDQAMLELLEILSYQVNDNHIDSVYGSLRSPWNSGRVSFLDSIDSSFFSDLVRKYNNYGVSVGLAFNNYNITENDLEDEKSNELLSILNEINKEGPFNSVIASSDLLLDHIVTNYPYLKITCSVIKPTYEDEDSSEYYNQLLDIFDEITPRPEYFFSDSAYDIDDKDRVIVLGNQTCFRNCPTAVMHYDTYEKIERGLPHDNLVIRNCMTRKANYPDLEERCIMTLDTINDLVNHGYTQFKLQGRNKSPIEFLDMLGKYVFEPVGWYQGVIDSISSRISLE